MMLPTKTNEAPQANKRALIAMLGVAATLGVAEVALAQTTAVPLGPNGSGSGGSSTGNAATVASLAALAALAPSSVSTSLTQAGRAGLFNWVAGNLETQVANDPAQAITVAWSGDSAPGASGAWVRQYSGPVSIGWFGAVGDAAITFPAIFGPPTIVSGTDNSGALAAFGMWARHQSSLGIPVHIAVPPPTGQGYLFNHSLCWLFLANIKKLKWDNNGALWQNSYVGSGSFNQPWGPLSSPLRNFPFNLAQAWLINQTTPGAFVFVLTTPSDASNIVVPSWMMLASLDIAYFGYPPNAQQYEYVRIVAVDTYASASVASASYNSGTGQLSLTFAAAPFGATVGSSINGAFISVSGLTGTGVASLDGTWAVVSTGSSGTVITLQTVTGLGTLTISGGTLAQSSIVTTEQSIRYAHLPTYPDDQPAVQFYPIGAGRVWQLDTGSYTITGANPAFSQSVPILMWDVEHQYNEMNIGCPLTTVAETYWSISARRVVTRNWVGPGFSESTAAQVIHDNPTILKSGEPDKLVESIEYRNMNFFTGQGSAGGFNFQSPIDRVTMTHSKISGGLVTGTVKNFYAENCDIDSLGIGGSLGFNNAPVFVGCRISTPNSTQLTLLDGSNLLTIDGTNVAFGTAGGGAGSLAGVLTVLKSAFPSGVGVWNAVPGMTVNLTANVNGSSLFTGATGNGVVLQIYEDATYFYIVTTLPFATLPAWSNNKIYFFHNSGGKFIRCSGSDTVRQASAAFDKGLDYWEYKKYILGGAFATNIVLISQVFGSLMQVTVTPLQIGVAPGANLTIQFASFDAGNNFTGDTFPGLQIKVYVGIAGQRVITQSTFANKQSGDAITVGGVAANFLPTNRVIGGTIGASFSLSTAGATLSNWQSPMVMVEMQFDCGIVRKVIPVNYDTGNDIVFATVGRLPS